MFKFNLNFDLYEFTFGTFKQFFYVRFYILRCKNDITHNHFILEPSGLVYS